jgi:mannose-6-phosphate isomerase-like protein (cupin superfamily)
MKDEIVRHLARAALDHDEFRHELVTTDRSQVVAMAIPPGDEIGEEVHPDTDQLLIFLQGTGEAVLDGETSPVGPGTIVLVEAGRRHNFVNRGDDPLRLVTLYTPPEHPPGTVHKTKADAEAAESH